MNKLAFKKNKESIRFILIIFFFIGGYLFFFTSSFWMPASIDASYLTKVGAENLWNDRAVTITRWDYCEEQSKMEVELSIENKSYDGKNKYVFYTVDSNGNKLVTEVKVEEPDWVVLQIKELAGKWSDISLRMEIADTDLDRLKLYTNVVDVNKVDKIEDLDRTGYLNKRFEGEIVNYKKTIEEKNAEIQKIENEISEIKKEINRLTEAELYQTEKQKQESEALIGDANSTISSKEKKISTLQAEIDEINKRIEMKQKQQEDLMK